MQNQLNRTQHMPGMRHNMLQDMSASVPMMADVCMTQNQDDISPFPEKTPIGMAYVPFQQWEEPYDLDTAFPIGTIFPSLNLPYRGGAGCV